MFGWANPARSALHRSISLGSRRGRPSFEGFEMRSAQGVVDIPLHKVLLINFPLNTIAKDPSAMRPHISAVVDALIFRCSTRFPSYVASWRAHDFE